MFVISGISSGVFGEAASVTATLYRQDILGYNDEVDVMKENHHHTYRLFCFMETLHAWSYASCAIMLCFDHKRNVPGNSISFVPERLPWTQ